MTRSQWISKILLAVSRLGELLSCKNVLLFMKKERGQAQKMEPRAQKAGPRAIKNYSQTLKSNQGTPICPVGFQNCYRPVTPLHLPFPPPCEQEYLQQLSYACSTILCMLGALGTDNLPLKVSQIYSQRKIAFKEPYLRNIPKAHHSYLDLIQIF